MERLIKSPKDTVKKVVNLKKIIVVDDKPDTTYSIKQILEKNSDEYEVITADSGKQCLELLQNNQIPDLILLDIVMPEMSGWDVYHRLKENPSWRNIPVIFITAIKDGITRLVKKSLGEENYIEKPFDIDELMKKVEKVLRSSG